MKTRDAGDGPFTLIIYTQCTVKLRPNFEKIAQLKCTTNEKRNLSERNLTVHLV